MSNPDLLSNIDEIVEFPVGAAIFREGEHGDFMYLILSGEVDVSRDGLQLAVRGPGEIIGEVAFFDGGGRSALVVARMPSRLAKINRKRFEHLVSNVPDFVALVLAKLNG
jgi:CRP-like cAMP-binding protein